MCKLYVYCYYRAAAAGRATPPNPRFGPFGPHQPKQHARTHPVTTVRAAVNRLPSAQNIAPPHRCKQSAALVVLVAPATVAILVGATCRITPVIALVVPAAAAARQLDLHLAAVRRGVAQGLVGFQPTHIAAGVACVGEIT